MTPTAVTPAARKQARPPGGAGTKRPSSPHPSTPRPAHRAARGSTIAPHAPRRVSGPARSAAAPTRPARAPRPASRPAVAPRRKARSTRTPRRTTPSLPLRTQALAFARTLPDHRLLDRLVRGRLWIPLLGVLLIGIVASQVAILKLNASLGHGVVRAAQLQSQDERLASVVSQLSDVQRVEASAARTGLSMPAAYTPVFLSGGRGELRRALSNIHRPDPTAFEARTAAQATHRAAEVQSSTGR